METAQKEFTFMELLDMSLGSSQLTTDHMAFLHALIFAILQRLNSNEEVVTLRGFEAQCLVKLLKECPDPPFECKIKDETCLRSKMGKLDNMIQRSEKISNKLEQHFDLARSYKQKVDSVFSGVKWDFYTGNAEDICSTPGRQCMELCEISGNGLFNQELRKIMTEPCLEHVYEYENLVDDMDESLSDLIVKTAKTFEEKNFLGPLISSIEKIRMEIRDNHNLFLDTMKEFQEMLDAKLDRIAYPAMRTYLKHYFEATNRTLASLHYESAQCPTTLPLPITKGTCLSCGVEKKQSRKQTTAPSPTECPAYGVQCSYQPEVNLRTRMKYLNVNLTSAASQFKLC